MRAFVKIRVTSDCCQKFGICGEQFLTDISFDKNGKVSATRFRFSHTPVHYQEDFIRDLILTRRVADLFSEKLIPAKQTQGSNVAKIDFDLPQSTKRSLSESVIHHLGLNTLIGSQETEAPIAFTYSLFYVFYDQYTYIRGVLA